MKKSKSSQEQLYYITIRGGERWRCRLIKKMDNSDFYQVTILKNGYRLLAKLADLEPIK